MTFFKFVQCNLPQLLVSFVVTDHGRFRTRGSVRGVLSLHGVHAILKERVLAGYGRNLLDGEMAPLLLLERRRAC